MRYSLTVNSIIVYLRHQTDDGFSHEAAWDPVPPREFIAENMQDEMAALREENSGIPKIQNKKITTRWATQGSKLKIGEKTLPYVVKMRKVEV